MNLVRRSRPERRVRSAGPARRDTCPGWNERAGGREAWRSAERGRHG